MVKIAVCNTDHYLNTSNSLYRIIRATTADKRPSAGEVLGLFSPDFMSLGALSCNNKNRSEIRKIPLLIRNQQ